MIINKNIDFTIIECCNCGVLFAVSEELRLNWLKTKDTFHCPNGHPQSYTKSTAETLQEKLNAKDKQMVEMNDKIYSLQAELNKKNRKKKSPK